jgi:hypothetical protein
VIRSKLGQRIMGALALLVGSSGTFWTWRTAITEGYYYTGWAVFFPLFAVVGLGLVLLPIDMEKQQAEYGDLTRQGFNQLPLDWKIHMGVAVVAALGNWFLCWLLGYPSGF